MRLDTFLLADAVSVAEGKAYILGAGITRINAPSLPLTVPITAFVRIQIESDDEVRVSHRFELGLFAPSGEAVIPANPVETPPTEPDPIAPGEERYLQVVAMLGVTFTEAGVYVVRFAVDGETLKKSHLPVVMSERDDRDSSVAAPISS